MSMSSSLCAFTIVILIIVVIFLMMQVQNNANDCREARETDQSRITEATKLIIESATQNHPILKLRNAIISERILQNVIDNNGGILKSEKNLKLKVKSLDDLKHKITQQIEDSQDLLMGFIIEQQPEYDISLNELAGLRKSKSKYRSKKRSQHSNHTNRDRE